MVEFESDLKSRALFLSAINKMKKEKGNPAVSKWTDLCTRFSST
jgi:hypothetical protein